MAEPEHYFFEASSCRLSYFAWGPKEGQPVLLVHATGFHARCWDRVVAELPATFRVIGVDLRGHGRSEKTGLMYDWVGPAQDLVELTRHLCLEGAIGAGHSKGGHLLVQVAAARPETFSRLVLIDPVMLAPEFYEVASRTVWPRDSEHPVARRRNHFTSWRQMFEAFSRRHPYSLWRPEVLEDYCRWGLSPRADGDGFELACPPEIEASIYQGSAGTSIYEQARTVNVPVTVLRARPRDESRRDLMDFAGSPTWPGTAGVFAQGRDVFLPHLTHFIPMQEPELVARFIADPDAAAPNSPS